VAPVLAFKISAPRCGRDLVAVGYLAGNNLTHYEQLHRYELYLIAALGVLVVVPDRAAGWHRAGDRRGTEQRIAAGGLAPAGGCGLGAVRRGVVTGSARKHASSGRGDTVHRRRPELSGTIGSRYSTVTRWLPSVP